MNSQDFRNLQEAYIGVYDDDIREKLEFESWVNNLLEEGYDLSDYTWDELYENYTQLDESGLSQDTIQRAVIARQKRNDAALKKDTPEGDDEFTRGFAKVQRSKSQLNINKKFAREGPTVHIRSRLGEEYTAYDIILEYLITEGYADTNENALVIMGNMSEEWRDDILNEGIGSAIRGLFGKKKKPEAPKPPSRGEVLRKKYGTETSPKQQILAKTYKRAESDKKKYGDSTYSRSVADKSAAEHDTRLRAGYSLYRATGGSGGEGGSGGSGSGNKARKRAAALNNSYDLFDYMMEYLMIEGYANTNENALVIMANMSEEWKNSIIG